MRGESARGILMFLSGTIVFLGRFVLDFPWPWPVGLAFVLIGVWDFWRVAHYLRNRSPSNTVLDQADSLESKDQIAAEHTEDQALLLAAEEERREIAELRHQAHYDPRAARELSRRLQNRLKMRAAAKRDFETNMADDPRLPTVLRNLEQANVETQRLLDELENNLRQLKP